MTDEVQTGGNVQNEQVATPTTNETDVANTSKIQETPKEKMYSKQQVTELMKQRVDKSHRSFFDRYGVSDLKGLDDLFKRNRDYDSMSNDYGNLKTQLAEAQKELSFVKNNIDPARYDDVNTYFKGKNYEFSEDGLLNELATHPEWLKQETIQPKIAIKPLGTFSKNHNENETKEAMMKKIYGG